MAKYAGRAVNATPPIAAIYPASGLSSVRSAVLTGTAPAVKFVLDSTVWTNRL